MWVSGKEFASKRGVDPSRVSQWKKQGRLVLSEDGKRIDLEASNAALDATLDQTKGMRREGNITSTAPEAPASAPRAPERTSRDDTGYWADKAREQAAVATLAEMRAQEKAGSLVSSAGVRKEAAETARSLRNAILAIPDRIAPVLDPGNPARAHKLLTDELQKALREFCSGMEQRASAAAGAEQPEPAVV